jgi:hypothetical protein
MVWYADKQGVDKVKVVTDAVMLLQENVKSVDELQLNRVEFAYLKALALFKSRPCVGAGAAGCQAAAGGGVSRVARSRTRAR